MSNPQDILNAFHSLYYNKGIWEHTTWMGHTIYKCPLDLWIYQEILFEIKPDFILETGTWHGGSALYFAHLLDIINHGNIISIDIEASNTRPAHDRIEYITSSSTAPEIVKNMQARLRDKKTLIVLDSDHTRDHVFAEMQAYADMVSIGSFMIVEDSNINGHPVREDFGPGPMEAIEDFLKIDDRFVIDESKEKFLMTQNPRGYLKRVK